MALRSRGRNITGAKRELLKEKSYLSTTLCNVYRSRDKSDYYLFVRREQDLGELPAQLMKQFGRPELAMTLSISPDRKLAQAQASDVLSALEEKGYYLQLPPTRDAYMASVRQRNEKL